MCVCVCIKRAQSLESNKLLTQRSKAPGERKEIWNQIREREGAEDEVKWGRE